jgi:hypothetical protein
MPASRCRKFGLLDAMVLVAATALGAFSLRLSRFYGLEMLSFFEVYFPGAQDSAYLGIALRLVSPWLAALSAALLVLRLRRDRPPWTRLLRQPGLTASLAATAAMVAGGLLAALTMALGGVPSADDLYLRVVPPITERAAVAVAAVWLVQATGRRWRPEPGWIDRAGRVVGACWVVVFVLGTWDDLWFITLERRYRPPGLAPAQVAAEAERQRKVEAELESLRLPAPAEPPMTVPKARPEAR